MLSLRSFLATLFLISIVFVGNVESQTTIPTSVAERYNATTGGATSRLWTKHLNPNDTNYFTSPDLIDWSYAGYQNGREPIPDTFALPVYDVTDYGAIANDGLSDTAGIRAAIRAARSGGIVLFPAGQFDIMTDGEEIDYIMITGSNIILKGHGAEGAAFGGTTIKQHNSESDYWKLNRQFRTQWRGEGRHHNQTTKVVGSYPQQARDFLVEDASSLIGKKYIKFQARIKSVEDWRVYSDVPRERFPGSSEAKRDGIDLTEYAEIDRIEGNRVFVKAPIVSALKSNFGVMWVDLSENMGFEDLHFDGGLDEVYEHHGDNGHYGYGGISFEYTAHSWVRRVRFSNTTSPVGFHHSYCGTGISIILDGKHGHQPVFSNTSTYTLYALVEDHSDTGFFHGCALQSRTMGTVYWAIGGPTMKGPDCHGTVPSFTLYDNYYSTTHEESSGTGEHNPHHLNGYVRWNNKSLGEGVYNLWGWRGEHAMYATEALLIGYIQPNAWGVPTNCFTESLGSHVSPVSLLEAQLKRRTDAYMWITDALVDHQFFFNTIFRDPAITRSGGEVRPRFPINTVTELSIEENTAAGTNIGDSFQVVRRNNLTIRYSLEGEGSEVFSISDPRTGNTGGQITTKLPLDYETKNLYELTVVASTLRGASNRLPITITIGNIIDENNIVNVPVSPIKFVPVNERTLEVQNAIIASLAPQSLGRRPTAEEVTAEHLADVVFLTIAPSLTELDKDDFEGLTGVVVLEIVGTGLTKLPKGVFRDLTSLQRLRLDHNAIKRLPGGIFEGMAHLNKLWLNNNQIKSLPNDSFEELLQLTFLNLNENQIKSIHRDTFKNQTNLQKLYLGNNNLKSLPQNLLFNLTSLARLHLYSNQLSEIPIGFFDHSIGGAAVLGNLTELSFSGNKVNPLVITISAKKKGPNKFVIKVDSGTPFDFNLPLIVNNGSIVDDPSHSLIKQGFSKSVDYTVVRGNDNTSPVTVDIGELPSIPALHSGYIVKKSADFPLQIFESVLRPIGGAPAIPAHNALLENFPNPFNPETWVPYQLSEKSRVRLTIYNLRGIIVRDINLGIQDAGFYTARSKAAYWDGKNEIGERVSSGIYFYQLKANKFSAMRKMIILK